MSADRRQSLTVLGAGIVGTQIARAAQVAGYAVTLIDASTPGHGTSFGNAGYIATDEIFPLARGRVLRSLPRMLIDQRSPLSVRWREIPALMPWLLRYARACSTRRAERSITALAGLQAVAGAAWQRTARRDGLGALLRTTGAWKLFETDAGVAATAAERAEQARYGIHWESVPRAALLARLPEIGPTIRHGFFYADGMSVVSPLAVTRALIKRFIADGGIVVEDEVNALSADNGRITHLDGARRRYAVEQLVIATGHRSGRLLEPLGIKVPIVAERGYHVEMSHQEISFDLPVGLFERGFYVTPMRSGLRLAGTTEFSSAMHDHPPNWARAEILKAHMAEVMPGVAEAETGRWMGHRPTLYDFLPVLGSLPNFNNVCAAFGHHHLGLTLSAISAEIVIAMLQGETDVVDLSPFRLARFQ